ncbi:lipid II:glycine glycyltransferase FemX, partial [Acidobacteriota bacterium]
MNVSILSPDDDQWRLALDGSRYEFYHLPAYATLEAKRTAGRACALYVENGDCSLLLPMVSREIMIGERRLPGPIALDATSPYGYPGLVVKAPDSEAGLFIRQAIDEATPVLKEAGIVCVFARLNPFLNTPDHYFEIGCLVEHGPSVWIDLTLSEVDLQRHLRSRYRSYINKLTRSGVTARFDLDFCHLRTFSRLYYQTMDRVSAAAWYYFDRSYFTTLKDILKDDLKLCLVEFHDKIVAAGLFAVSNGIVQYLFSGTESDADQPHATKLMMVYVRDWAKKCGLSVFNLGGGLGSQDDSLYQFKRGFSKLSKSFFSWRLVINQQLYREAVSVWRRCSSLSEDDQNGYFPAYRKP